MGQSNFTIDNCIFENNFANISGSALYLSNSSSVITNSIFRKERTYGILIFSQAIVNVGRGGRLNNASNSVGALFSTNGITSIDTCDFDSNIGSGIASISDAHLSVTSSTIRNNSALVGGGMDTHLTEAIFISNCTFKYNQANFGGGLHTLGGVAVINNNTVFDRNSAQIRGGGAVFNGTDLTSRSTQFTNNNATNGGGAFFTFTNAFLIANAFSSNVAIGAGGGFLVSSGNVTVNDSLVEFNSAAAGGGFGTGNRSATVTLNNLNCTNNYAQVIGGCASFSNALVNATVTSSSIAQNTAAIGAGVFVLSSDVVLRNTDIKGNSANGPGGRGGGVANQGTLLVDSCTIIGNRADIGGGIWANSSTTMFSSSLVTNTATTGGGGVFVAPGSIFISESTISSNTAQIGGGVYSRGAYTEIDATVITDNVAHTRGGGIFVESQDDALVLAYSSTFLGNSAPADSAIYVTKQPIFTAYLLSTRITNVNNSQDHVSFCCNKSTLANPIDQFCNFPACDQNCSQLSVLTACDCPINYQYVSDFIPIMPTVSDTQCSCATGSYGSICNGDACTFNSECSDNAHCEVFGSDPTRAWCVCNAGSAGDGANCTQVCEANNGGCDQRVECTSPNGVAECGPCPTGTHGDPFLGCIVDCGDDICNGTIGETCISCPQDCRETDCGLCGDLSCNKTSKETCSSCPEDCGPCKPKKCKSSCSHHGTCKDGQCICTPPFTGPICSTDGTQPITVNATTPNITLGTSELGNATFGISLLEISEKTRQNEVVRSYSLKDINFTTAETDTGLNKKFTFSAILDNKAKLVVLVSQFEESSTSVEFANETTVYPPHTLKLAFAFYNWPFMELSNSLEVVINSGVSGNNQESKTCVKDSTDQSGSLLWIMVIIDDVSLYGQFTPLAVLDGRVRNISYFLNGDNTISVSLPHFWDSAEIDPQFSVLLSDSQASCAGSKSKVNLKLILPIIFGVLLLVILFIIVFPRARLWWKLRHLKRVKSSETESEKEIEIEKIGEMEVNTASGRYVVQL
eukprot:Phypoly_transcript_01537.p1 GENE.Phypoly_transcript_01537~~Phypoly_transcript_01537.p1  ORF type:complete len:1066 (+),score=142.70 Phypoly_transcript_01537:113-3199(+)